MTDTLEKNTDGTVDVTLRQHWISVLSRSSSDELCAYWEDLSPGLTYSMLRQPETGLVMVRARAGGKGQRFNLGEASVTRCSVSMETGEVGHGYVTGRNKRHAEMAAVFDALLQNEKWKARLLENVITPIDERIQKSKNERQAKVASTKVDFFTMVRGEDE